MIDRTELYDYLKAGFLAQGLNTLDVSPFVTYLEQLHQWNKAYNLTAIRNPQDMVTKHVLDSLSILPMLQGASLIDVGTGPGLPGIPLALARSDLQIVLLDSNGKKIRFLREVVRVLQLLHVDVVQARVEAYKPNNLFDTVVSRAFSSAQDMVQKTRHLMAKNGQWLAMKGHVLDNEREALDDLNDITYHIKPLEVTKALGARCCILIKQK